MAASWYLNRLNVTLFQYHSTVNVCMSSLCILEFYYFNHFSEARCTCVHLFSILPKNGTPVPKHVGISSLS
jgi:hypothetical protein